MNNFVRNGESDHSITSIASEIYAVIMNHGIDRDGNKVLRKERHANWERILECTNTLIGSGVPIEKKDIYMPSDAHKSGRIKPKLESVSIVLDGDFINSLQGKKRGEVLEAVINYLEQGFKPDRKAISIDMTGEPYRSLELIFSQEVQGKLKEIANASIISAMVKDIRNRVPGSSIEDHSTNGQLQNAEQQVTVTNVV